MLKKMFLLSILLQIFCAFFHLQSYWVQVYNGLTDDKTKSNWLDFRILDLMVYNNTIYVTTHKGVFASTDNGNNWIKKNKGIIGDTIKFAKFAYNNNYMYFCVPKTYFTYLDTSTGKYISDSSGYSGIYYSTDNGENWIATKRNGLTDSNHVSAIAANDSLLIVGTSNKQGVYISKDKGENWVQKKNGLEAQTIFSIIIKNNLIYLATNRGVYLSSDYGENWINKLFGITYVVYLKGDTLIAGQWLNGFNLSTDNGDNWEQKNYGLREKDVMDVTSLNNYLFIAIKPSTVYRDPAGGVHFSSNNGDTWNVRNKGFRQTGAKKIAIKDEYIFCVIGYGLLDSTFGIYRAKLSELLNPTGVDFETLTKEHFYAAPAKPNPASDIVRAGIYWDAKVFDVENAEKGIYDIMGNKVGDKKDLLLTNIQPYSAEIVWNCSKASSGLYFIVLNYNGQTRTIPVLVIR